MSADGFLPVTAERDIAEAVLSALRADAGVRAVFGDPPRVFDDETDAPATPFARLERHETEPAGAAGVEGQSHRFTFVMESRHGGRLQAKAALGALRRAVETATLSAPGQHVVLVLTTYSDVVRTRDRRRFRGLLQLRITTERVTP